MKQFFITYHSPVDFSMQMQDRTPEEMQEGMKAWMDWAAKAGDALVDFGSPLMSGYSLTPSGSSEASSRGMAGYSIMQGESLEAVMELLKSHPHLHWDSSSEIEIHEIAPTPGS